MLRTKTRGVYFVMTTIIPADFVYSMNSLSHKGMNKMSEQAYEQSEQEKGSVALHAERVSRVSRASKQT